MNQTTSASSMTFVSLPNSAWQIYPVTVNGQTYYPIYAAGNNISAGYNLEVDFIPMRNLWFDDTVVANISEIYWVNNSFVSKETTFVAGTHPDGLAFTPNGKYVYVADPNDNTLSVIYTSNFSMFKNITITVPWDVAITPNGQYAYVTGNAGVSVVSTSSNSVVATISTTYPTWGIAITPNGQYVYADSATNGVIYVISTSSNSIIATISTSSPSRDIAITPNGQYAYVVSNGVLVISTSSNSVVATIPGISGYGVAITPNGQYAYVANSGYNSVSVISTSSNSVISTIPVGVDPRGLALTPNGQYVYVVNLYDNDLHGNISVISTSSNSVITTILGTPENSCGISYGPFGDACW